ncbi:MAG: hypothetical protein IKI37_01905 [Oscillospiraceae bacterium]|nr:hypothetical protein [Oscillospiraceae bacterium]
MYQYESVKLEKGMYHLTNKSFLQALEEADPSSQYSGSPLANLDAYERQLKRFDIHVSGSNCDKVEKFFTTTESAVLFPEFIRRAILQGMEDTFLPEIVALESKTNCSSYYGCDFSDSNAYTTTSAGNALPITSIIEAISTTSLLKYGRNIQATYEAIRQQRLNIYERILRRVGMRLAGSIAERAITVLKNVSNNTTKISVATANFNYNNLVALYGGFTSFKMKILLASPANIAKILTMSQMIEISSQNVNEIRMPFGTKLITCAQIDDNTILGLDSDFALEQIQNGDLVLETDKIIERQLDSITVSASMNFRPFIADATRQLGLT